jgi:HK97 family phage portal protein
MFTLFRRKKTRTRPTFTGMPFNGSPQWAPRNYKQFAQEGYGQNVIVHRCVGEIARGISSVPFVVYKGDTKQPYHKLNQLLNRPNGLMGAASFKESLIGYYLIAGNAYVQLVTNDQGLPVDMNVLRPDRVQILPSKTNLPAGYIHTTDHHKETIKADPLTGESSVLHLKAFHPHNDWYGLSPIEAAAFSIDQHNAAGAHNQALLQNGARPTGAFLYKPVDGMGMDPDQREFLRQQMQDTYTGARNAGKIMVVEGDVEWREMGLKPRDMDFVATKESAARDIAQAFGVPPVLVGIPGDATYNNMAEARLALWEQTIIPLLDHLIDRFNQWLVPYYPDTNLRLTYDRDHISALSIKRNALWDRLQQADFLTTNEKRAAVGYPPLAPTGDIS